MSRTAWEVSCLLCRRVVLTSYDRAQCVQALLVHRISQHSEASTVLVQSRDLSLIPAPTRCDLCGVLAERPWWEYRTTPGAAEDDSWLVCDACHALVQQRQPLPALMQRVVRQQQQDLALDGASRRSQRANVRRVLQAFLDQLAGPPVRET